MMNIARIVGDLELLAAAPGRACGKIQKRPGVLCVLRLPGRAIAAIHDPPHGTVLFETDSERMLCYDDGRHGGKPGWRYVETL